MRIFTTFACTVSATALVLASVAPAAAEPVSATAGDTMSFGVFAIDQERPTGTFDIEDLAEFGLEDEQITRLSEGVLPEPEPEAQAMAVPDDVITTWDDVDGDQVVWRRGHYNPATGRGSGALKIDQKHNLSLEAVRSVTRWPYTSQSVPANTKTQEMPPNGTTYRYRSEVWEVECSGWLWWRTCKIVDDRVVRAIVDFRSVPGSTETKGAFNAYCEQTTGDRCPDWVRNALNI